MMDYQTGTENLSKYDLWLAHKAALCNKDVLEKDSRCGCFYCRRIFSPFQIEEWCLEEEGGEEVTAICPYCGIDSVIAESSGYPLTDAFLETMRKGWFGE